jgi:hypothetical protein
VGAAASSATFRIVRSLTIAFRMAWIRIIRTSLTLLLDRRSASVPGAVTAVLDVNNGVCYIES